MASTSVLICLLALQGICLARAPPQDSPPTSTLQDLDKDLDRLMEDERLFNECYLCLIDMGPCTRDTSNFRGKEVIIYSVKGIPYWKCWWFSEPNFSSKE